MPAWPCMELGRPSDCKLSTYKVGKASGIPMKTEASQATLPFEKTKEFKLF